MTWILCKGEDDDDDDDDVDDDDDDNDDDPDNNMYHEDEDDNMEDSMAEINIVDLGAAEGAYSDAEESAAAPTAPVPATPVVDMDSDGGGQLSTHSSTEAVQDVGLTLQDRSDSVPALPDSGDQIMPFCAKYNNHLLELGICKHTYIRAQTSTQ